LSASVRQLCELVEKTINAIERDHGMGTSAFVMVDLLLVLLIVRTVVENAFIRL